MSKKKHSRLVYVVLGHNFTTKSTYVSEVCSSQKKAEEFCKYIGEVMAKHDPDTLYTHWFDKQRVS